MLIINYGRFYLVEFVLFCLQDPQNSSRNRGFAFVLYYNNACADYSRQKMLNSDFKLEGNTPSISWADPKGTPDHSAAAAQVKYKTSSIKLRL